MSPLSRKKVYGGEISNKKTREKMSEFLEDYETLYENFTKDNIEEIESLIENMEQPFYGYSMYEVDGVFFNSRKFDNSKRKKPIIRIIFAPNIENIFQKLEIDKSNKSKEFRKMKRFAQRC